MIRNAYTRNSKPFKEQKHKPKAAFQLRGALAVALALCSGLAILSPRDAGRLRFFFGILGFCSLGFRAEDFRILGWTVVGLWE